jgi:hypothetical protein
LVVRILIILHFSANVAKQEEICAQTYDAGVEARTFAAWIKENTLLVSGSPGIFPSRAVSLGIMHPPTSCSLPERGARGQRASSLTHSAGNEKLQPKSAPREERMKYSADANRKLMHYKRLGPNADCAKNATKYTACTLRVPEASHFFELWDNLCTLLVIHVAPVA